MKTGLLMGCSGVAQMCADMTVFLGEFLAGDRVGEGLPFCGGAGRNFELYFSGRLHIFVICFCGKLCASCRGARTRLIASAVALGNVR